MNFKKNSLLLALFCALPFASNLPAQVSSMDFSFSGTGLSGTVTVPQFNPNLGLLEGIILNESFSMQVNYTLANATSSVWVFNPNPNAPSSSPEGLGQAWSDFYVTGASAGVILYFNSPSTNISVPAGSGFVGFPGTVYGRASGSYTIANTLTGQVLGNSTFIGTGTVDLNYLNTLNQTGNSNPETTSVSLAPDAANTSLNVDLTYYYLPVPEPSTSAFIAVSGGIFMLFTRVKKIKSRQD